MSEAEEFLGTSSRDTTTLPSEVLPRRKLLMILASWIVGLLLASPGFDPRAVLYIPLFPFGLLGLVNTVWTEFDLSESFMLLLGWIIFFALSITTLVMATRKWFFTWWVITTILLLINGAGCHAMWKGLNSI